MSSARATATSSVDMLEVCTNPRADGVWHHEGAWWAPLSRPPYVGAVALGAVMVIVTIVVAALADLPLRDADGLSGPRMWILLATLAAFFALDIVPRVLRRARGAVTMPAGPPAVLSDRRGPRTLLGVALRGRHLPRDL